MRRPSSADVNCSAYRRQASAEARGAPRWRVAPADCGRGRGPHSVVARAIAKGLAVATLAVLASVLGAGCERESRPSDIILITLDTTRADRLRCYGSDIASTPHLDRFAHGAVQCMQAITPVPLTLPSHASMMTGRQPPEHGVRDNAGYRLPEEAVTLAEILGEQGYTTAAFVSAYILTPRFGLSQGFETYDADPMNERPGAETTRAAVTWLESIQSIENLADRAGQGTPENLESDGGARSAEGSPIFLWVHYFDPHTPWTPPEPFASETRGTPYDAEISAMDAAVGDLLAALRRVGRFDAAHIVMVGDHGEGLGDHIEREHGIFLYEETLHVPLMWKLPGQTQGRRALQLVSTVDLFSAILEQAGVALPEGLARGVLSSLLEDPSAQGAAGVYAETLHPFVAHNWSPLYVWRTEVWKLVEAPEAELYNLRADPEERANLARDRAAVRESLRTVLDDYRRGLAAVPADAATQRLTPEAEARLRSLGYVTLGASTEAAGHDTLPDPKRMAPLEVPLAEARVAAEDGRWSDAEISFRAALAASPGNVAALEGLGRALLEQGRPREASEALERALDRSPRSVDALEALAAARVALGEKEAALTILRRAQRVATAAEEARLLEQQIEILLSLGRFADAAQCCAELDRMFAALGRATPWRTRAQAATALGSLGIGEPSADPEVLAVQLQSLAILEMGAEWERLLNAAREIHEAGLIDSLAATTRPDAPSTPVRVRRRAR